MTAITDPRIHDFRGRESKLADSENALLSRMFRKDFLIEIAELYSQRQVEEKVYNDAIAAMSDAVNILMNFSWNGIGVFAGENPGSVECVIDCFDSKKRLTLEFSTLGVHVRQIGQYRVQDMGVMRRPYALDRQVKWLVNDEFRA